MIHSGLVNQRRGGGFERGYPNQRVNHPRDQEVRPWVSGFDLPVMEKSQYATPSAPEGTSKVGVEVVAPAQVFYENIFGKTASPDAKYYLSQLIKRIQRGGGVGRGTDGGGGPGGMGGPQRPTGPVVPPPGQLPIPGAPVEAPGGGPGEPEPVIVQDVDDQQVPLGDYTIADLQTEMEAEVEFDDVFDTRVPHVHGEDVTSAGPTTGGSRLYPELPTEFEGGLVRTNAFNADTGSSYRSVFDAAANALSTTAKVGAVLPQSQMLRTALLQALPEKYAGPALALTRKIEDMQTKLGRTLEDYVVVPAARAIAGPIKENLGKAITRGTKRAYDAAARVAGLAERPQLGPATFDTAIRQGNVPVDQIEKIIRETFGDLNERGMEAFIQKNIETARMGVSDRLVGETQLMRAAQGVAGSRIGNIAQLFVRLVAFIAFSNFVPRDQAMQIANNFARGAPGSRLRPIATLRAPQRYGFQ